MTAQPASAVAELPPPFIVTYGPTKLGKTADALWTAGASGAFVVYHADGVSGARDVIGMTLRPDQIRIAYRLETAIQHVQVLVAENAAYLKQHGQKLYRFIVVDDLSMLVENELIAMKQMSRYKRGEGYDFTLWTDLMDKLIGFGNVARFGDLIVLANAHVRDPSTNAKGEFFRGGPYLPSAKMVRKLPHIATSIWKVEQMAGLPLWPVGIRCEPDPSFIMGDRRGLRGTAPLNTAERLRSLGFDVPRPVGLEWIEEWSAAIADKLDGGRDLTELTRKARDTLVAKGHPQQHVYWAVRDGVHRHVYRKIASSSLLSLI